MSNCSTTQRTMPVNRVRRVGPKNRDGGLVTFHGGLPDGVLSGSKDTTSLFLETQMSRADALSASKRLRSGDGYRHPRSGEPRRQRKPLRIDRLAQDVRETIVAARETGKTWQQISSVASAKAGEYLAPSTIQRWHDLRVEQQKPSAMLRRIVELLEGILEAVRS
jgi:hypothetical protein